MDLKLEIYKNIHINNLNRDNERTNASSSSSGGGQEDNNRHKEETIKNHNSMVNCIDWYNNEEIFFIM